MQSTLQVLINQLPAIITAIGVILVGYWSYKARQQSKNNADAIETVRQDVNGQAAARLAEAKIASHAEGMLAEKEREK